MKNWTVEQWVFLISGILSAITLSATSIIGALMRKQANTIQNLKERMVAIEYHQDKELDNQKKKKNG